MGQGDDGGDRKRDFKPDGEVEEDSGAAGADEEKTESMGILAAAIVTALVLIASLPIIVSIASGETNGIAQGIAGIFFGEMVGWLQVVGDVFIRLLQITVIPYISLSLITGLGSMRRDEVGRLSLKGGAVILVIWTIPCCTRSSSSYSVVAT